MNIKEIGSYYTPDFLAKFIINFVKESLNTSGSLSILEPSVGDGAFLKAFLENNFGNSSDIKFTSIELNDPELTKAKNIFNFYSQGKNLSNFQFFNQDFLDWQKDCNDRFNLIIGNPPYIKSNLLTSEQISNSHLIFTSAGLNEKFFKNIWSSFLIRCTQLLTENGILAFVLPAEFLQVNFSKQIRKFLKSQFDRIEVFTFNQLMFESTGQDTIILFGYRESQKQKGIYFSNVSDISQLEEQSFFLNENVALSNSETKWTHHILSSDEISFLYNLYNSVNKIKDFCSSKPGVVTAANDFFIVSEKVENFYNLNHFTEPIIQKGAFVNGSVIFSGEDYATLVKSGKPSKFLRLSEDSISSFPPSVIEYLSLGLNKKIHTRHKCGKRKVWFIVPNIVPPGHGLFFKRCHSYPKLLVNEANILVTDAAYNVYMKDNFNIESLVFSFYNSLTLTFAELFGRYYGGGVLELTPNEFRDLPLPYNSISLSAFKQFSDDFKLKHSIFDVTSLNDFSIFKNSLKIDSETILKINEIKSKLILKRLR
ncbi:N-6 DNA methylase [Larkinella soli]|uniref:N-6 DNA methylase n=1 Tax=Larkinella soli TaxID=1770527 RepID=UPI000FFB8858|nr:N-6 DNA methylase [Larkinella soli]